MSARPCKYAQDDIADLVIVETLRQVLVIGVITDGMPDSIEDAGRIHRG